jgi:hypothetical protein
MIKNENKSAKQEQTASERPEQTYRTKRVSKNTKEISSTYMSGIPVTALVNSKLSSCKIMKIMQT